MLYAFSNLLYAPSKCSRSNISMKSLLVFVNSNSLCSYLLIQIEVYLIGLFPVRRIFCLLERHHGGAKYCSMLIQNVSGVAQCAFKIWQELLYCIRRRLEQHNLP
jgi:hypothetical protein